AVASAGARPARADRPVRALTACASSVVLEAISLLGDTRGGLDHQRVHERLREVAAQLPLPNVVLLREQPGRAARRAVALEPANRLQLPALLKLRERGDEAAEHE